MQKPLFRPVLHNWEDWSRVFTDAAVFDPLIRAILLKEGLPYAPPVSCTPGTHAVFFCGALVIKLYSPACTQNDGSVEYESELKGLAFAKKQGVLTARPLAWGIYEDAYPFCYLVTSRIQGEPWGHIYKQAAPEERFRLGRLLRDTTIKLNVPADFSLGPPVKELALKTPRFSAFSEAFQQERLRFLESWNDRQRVFVHGDLNGDNVFITPEGKLLLLDFGDALLAPRCYEEGLLSGELLLFDKAGLAGYFGSPLPPFLSDYLLTGLLLHDYGGNCIREHTEGWASFSSLQELRDYLRNLIR